MKKSDNYGNSSLILFITTGLIMFILAIVTKDKNAKTIFIIAGFSNIILGYIEMAITTIKKYIDKVFEDKVRNIQVDEQSNDLLDAREYFLQGLGKEIASKCGISATALGLEKEVKYRKKPVVIEAFQYDGDLINSKGEFYGPEWAENAYNDGILYYDSLNNETEPCELFIKTLEGIHHVSVNDYIIQGVQGELYPCKPDIFEKSYEEVTK